MDGGRRRRRRPRPPFMFCFVVFFCTFSSLFFCCLCVSRLRLTAISPSTPQNFSPVGATCLGSPATTGRSSTPDVAMVADLRQSISTFPTNFIFHHICLLRCNFQDVKKASSHRRLNLLCYIDENIFGGQSVYYRCRLGLIYSFSSQIRGVIGVCIFVKYHHRYVFEILYIDSGFLHRRSIYTTQSKPSSFEASFHPVRTLQPTSGSVTILQASLLRQSRASNSGAPVASLVAPDEFILCSGNFDPEANLYQLPSANLGVDDLLTEQSNSNQHQISFDGAKILQLGQEEVHIVLGLMGLFLCHGFGSGSINLRTLLRSYGFSYFGSKLEPISLTSRLLHLLSLVLNLFCRRSSSDLWGNLSNPNLFLWTSEGFVSPLAEFYCWILGLVGFIGDLFSNALIQGYLVFIIRLLALILLAATMTSVRESRFVLWFTRRLFIRVGFLPDQRPFSLFEKFQTATNRALIGLSNAVLSWSTSGRCAILSIKHLDPIEGLFIRGAHHRLSMRFGALSIYFLCTLVSRFDIYIFSFWPEDTIKQNVVFVID